MNEETVVFYLKRSRIIRGLRAHSWFLLLILLSVMNRTGWGQNLSEAGHSSEEHLSAVDASTIPNPDDSRRVIPLADFSRNNDRPSSDVSSSASGATGVVLAKPAAPPEKFHFWPAMLQSLEFTVSSDAFRVATDSGLQYQLAHLPFYHDWFVSYGGYNLHRWADGDDFIVNDVGHPLQGAVFSRIFFQNSPRGRSAVIGKNRDYWITRLKAVAWTAAWEAQWKVGPFSETSIGNAGGFIYLPGCGYKASCLTDPPKGVHKPPTNNTGLSDWVMTPWGGMLWVMGEDTLEKYVVVPVARNHRILGGRILRAVLEPSKDWAALFMGKLVWQLPNENNNFVMPTKKAKVHKDDESTPVVNHWELGAQYTNVSLPVVTKDCLNCRQYSSGVGFNFVWSPSRMFGIDSAVYALPGQGGARPMTEGLFGARLGEQKQNWAVFAKIRPGFIYYEDAVQKLGEPNTSGLTRFATDFGAVAEVYPNRNSTLRLDVGTTLVRYLTDRTNTVTVSHFGSLLSDDIIVTQGNFQVSTGYVYRF
jgi:hypothetical protein